MRKYFYSFEHGKKCLHKKVIFVGYQETLEEGKFLKLYRCLLCNSTITLNSKKVSKV